MEKSLRILIVDDEEIMRDLFSDILIDEGHSVEVVCNGKEAQEKMKNTIYDLIFVDVHMPVMDGLSTLRMILKNRPKSKVVMTDSMPGFLLEEFKKEGAVTCLHKPFHIQQVRMIVKQIIEQERNRDDEK